MPQASEMAQWVTVGEGKAKPSDLSVIAWVHQKVVLLSKVPGTGSEDGEKKQTSDRNRVGGHSVNTVSAQSISHSHLYPKNGRAKGFLTVIQ